MIGKAISFACAMAAGATALRETQPLQMGALENNLAQADIDVDHMNMHLDEDDIFAQLSSQEELGWGSISPKQPSVYDLLYQLFDSIKYLKQGQQYLMKKVHWLDYKSNENMMELEALEPVKPLVNRIAVNQSQLLATANTANSASFIQLASIVVAAGQTVEIRAVASIEVSIAGANIQILQEGIAVPLVQTSAKDPGSGTGRQPAEIATVIWKETRGATGATYTVRIASRDLNADTKPRVAPQAAQVEWKIYAPGYTAVVREDII